jgi:ATP-dependent DNA helicase RecG
MPPDPETKPVKQFLWQQPVKMLPGVAARRATQLNKLGIETWFDLLCWFPRDYENWADLVPLSELADGQEQTFQATVLQKPSLNRKGRLSMLRTVLGDGPLRVAAIWFNQPWLADKLAVGMVCRFHGLIKRAGRTFQVQNPAFEPVGNPDEADPTFGYKPVYRLTAGINQGVMRQLIQSLLTRTSGNLPEPLPAWLRRRFKLCAADFAYSRIHQPADEHDIELCRRRIGFEELFLLRTGLWLLRRHRSQEAHALALEPDATARTALEAFLDRLPFELTGAQRRSWQEIQADLARSHPMNRLLQGDVGSGKTVVAALAMLACTLGGAQSALMAPTSILARQHHQTLCRILEGSGPAPVLLTGATRAAEKRDILAGLADGSIRMVVGTHALLEDVVVFQRLALTITDEQHRFGVGQRRRLGQFQDSGDSIQPHVLVMSATPIPRSLALVLYGDMDVSLIDELPAGRSPVATYTAASRDRPRIEQLMRRTAGEGRQVYVVCPMIEEQEALDLESVTAVYNRLAQQVFPDFKVGLLHGSLRQAVKDEVMDDFMANKLQILVSTTVIEVGVDNPNATLMVIENAERFGLAQLHQLRGRIGRGAHRSLCVLISDSNDDLGRKRLRAICHAADGFAVAEQDLQLRGPGDFFGTRQHGLPPLRMANLYRDTALMYEVQQGLETMVREDPDLQDPEHSRLRAQIVSRYSDVFRNIGL